MAREFGKSLLTVGLSLAALGALFMALHRVPWLGRLPGDLWIRRGRFTLSIPLATCVLASLVISLLLRLLSRR